LRSKLFQTALDEAIKFGSAARLVLTFPGNEEALHIHPLAYTTIEDGGFRIEIRPSQFDDQEVMDDVIFVDSDAVETVELQVKQRGSVWQDEPYRDRGIDGEED
jgi:hypothetical protein